MTKEPKWEKESEPVASDASSKKKKAAAIGYESEIQIRVRYQETDQMGVVYHGNYFAFFEMGRTELLREATGCSYRDVEERGVMMVVSEAHAQYLKPARYDDLLTLRTRVANITAATLVHEYELYRDGELLVKGGTTLVCVDKRGKIVPVPKWIRDFSRNPDESASVS